jgi:TolA-binding protein
VIEDAYKKELDVIRKRLSWLLEIDEKIVTRNYDSIKLEKDNLLEKTRLIKSLGFDKKYEKQIEGICSLADNVVANILRIGSLSKEEVLAKLDEIDFCNNDDEIKETLGWIQNKLELDTIELEDDINNTYIVNQKRGLVEGKTSFGGISARQLITYENCLKHAMSKSTCEAVHSLKEFIDNYQIGLQEPFSSFERISIRLMITLIIQGVA